MKRNAVTAALLCLSLLLTMTACGKSAPENKDSIGTPEQEYSNPSEITEGSDDYVPEQANSKILIAYFSVPEDVNMAGVDAVSGASVVVKDGEKLGNTQYVAQLIHEVVGGDLFRIETTNEYPLEHDALLSYASDEQSKSARPELITQAEDFEQYDVILLGYPNWWYDMPMPIYTFLESYDFRDKTIIPFITHGGSRASGTLDTIGELAPEAEIYEEPLILSRNDVAGSGDTVKSWAESLWKGSVTPDVLDENYVPDALDLVSADAAAIGHIYSFYGRLSVGSTDVEKFRQSNLPPTFYAYGTEDPFYRQFMANADAVREAGVSVEEHCYDGQPHGFGAGNTYSNWVPEFDRWLTEIYENN